MILIVEDDHNHAELMSVSLQNSPEVYRLLIAGSLSDARTFINGQTPDIVLTDYRLPDGDGSELVQIMNGLCPVILLTSQGNEQVAVDAIKAGALDYIVKSAGAFTGLSRITQRCMREWRLIREQKKSEEELRKSEAKQRAMVANISDVIAIIDQEGFIRYKSPNIEKWFGWRPEEVVDSSFWTYVHPEDLCRTRDFFSGLLQEPHAGGTAECRYRCMDNRYKYIEITAVNLVHDSDIHGVLLNYRDITESKLAAEELRDYASRLIEVEEGLRKKLAAELHDEIGRDLTAIGMNLSIISERMNASEQQKLIDMVHDSSRLIEGISRTVRSIMSYLRPPVLDDFGLLAALRWHADLYTKRNGIAVIIQSDDHFPRLKPEKETSIFRISQEALINAAKYTDTKKITITLQISAGLILFSVADEGKGFLVASSAHHQQGSGWGMKIMRERAELMGGSFQVTSRPGRGTVVSVSLPFEEV